MKSKLTILIFLLFSKYTFCQKIYQAQQEDDVSDKYILQFYLYNDSSCYLKKDYFNNKLYTLYKGRLKKYNDSIYEFKFQPVVIFSTNMANHIQDSARVYFSQQDTVITSLTYKIRPGSDKWKSVTLNGKKTTVFIKGSRRLPFLINTKFTDPLTKQIVIMTINTNSDPNLVYYGSQTQFYSLKMTFNQNGLLIYPDHKFIKNKEIFTLKK